MSHIRYHVFLNLVFPEGLHPGDGREGNLFAIATDGRGRPVLRGTALAGAIRHAYAADQNLALDDDELRRWFGAALEDADDLARYFQSKLSTSDCVLASSEDAAAVRTHNAVDRHTGAVLEGSLFSIPALPPGTTTTVFLELDDDSGDSLAFLQTLVGILEAGTSLGGNAARGIGRVTLRAPARYRRFDLQELEQHAAYLASRRASMLGSPPGDGDILTGTPRTGQLVIRVDWCIPPGQDLLVADGQGFDHKLEPQVVRCTDGKTRYRLPGSAIRAALRGWMTRLAARAGLTVSDSVARHRSRQADGEILQGDLLAWDFVTDADERRHFMDHPEDITCPILDLFGSGYSRSRIRVSDAIGTEVADTHEQVRMHVAVDQISGGAHDGMLFDNTVLAGDKLSFPTHITIDTPEEREVQWLAAAIRAIDMGLIRLGSSKAGGRLSLASSPTATGPHAGTLESLNPMEVIHA